MTEHQHSPAGGGEAGAGVPARDERLFWFLTILDGMGGTSDASDTPRAWINTFCGDRPTDPDTYNLADKLGYTRTSHETSFDISTVRLTAAGRTYLAVQRPAPAQAPESREPAYPFPHTSEDFGRGAPSADPDLETLAALSAAATQGTWHHRQAHDHEGRDWIADAPVGVSHSKIIAARGALYGGGHDYAFVSAAVNYVRKLLAARPGALRPTTAAPPARASSQFVSPGAGERDEEAEELFQSERISAALAAYDEAMADYDPTAPDHEVHVFDAMKFALLCADNFRGREPVSPIGDDAAGVESAPTPPAGAEARREEIATTIRKHLRLTRFPYGDSEVDHVSVDEAADAILALAPAPPVPEEVWRPTTEAPEVGRKIVALWDDGGGAALLWIYDGGMLDSDGDEAGPWPPKGCDRWTYLPRDLEFYCEIRLEDPVTLSLPPASGPAQSGEERS